MSAEVIKALAVAAELTNTELSKVALVAMEQDLSRFNEGKVLDAIGRARREITSKLTLAAIIDRIDDGRPKADEAWSIAVTAMDEYATVVMNEDIAEAWGVSRKIYEEGDEVGARMAFRSTYERITRDKKGMPVRWWPSFGEDKSRRDVALIEAVQLGRLTASVANQYLPAPIDAPLLLEERGKVDNVIREALKRLPE
jgi:hypothetical protein